MEVLAYGKEGYGGDHASVLGARDLVVECLRVSFSLRGWSADCGAADRLLGWHDGGCLGDGAWMGSKGFR